MNKIILPLMILTNILLLSGCIAQMNTHDLEKRISFKIYGIQNILNVPNVTIINKTSLITYRTEIHNGTENGVLLVLCKNVNNRIKPLFVIEELFYISDNDYYQRKASHITDKSMFIELFHNYNNKEKKLLSAKIIYNDSNIKIEKLEKYEDEDMSNIVISYFENYKSISSQILSCTF